MITEGRASYEYLYYYMNNTTQVFYVNTTL